MVELLPRPVAPLPPPYRSILLSSFPALRPRPLAITAAVLALVVAVTLAVALQPTDDTVRGSLDGPHVLSASDVTRHTVPSFVGPEQPPAYPDLTPEPGDPGTYGEEAIGYPEVVAAAVEAPRAAAAPSAATGSVWDRLAVCEAGGNWASTVGLYEGGLQFHPDTWDAYKPAGYPEAAYQASRDQQILVAERVLAQQGWAAWPACSRKLGLR